MHAIVCKLWRRPLITSCVVHGRVDKRAFLCVYKFIHSGGLFKKTSVYRDRLRRLLVDGRAERTKDIHLRIYTYTCGRGHNYVLVHSLFPSIVPLFYLHKHVQGAVDIVLRSTVMVCHCQVGVTFILE